MLVDLHQLYIRSFQPTFLLLSRPHFLLTSLHTLDTFCIPTLNLHVPWSLPMYSLSLDLHPSLFYLAKRPHSLRYVISGAFLTPLQP